jgi:hypothetical protein
MFQPNGITHCGCSPSRPWTPGAIDAAVVASKIRKFRPFGENPATIELPGPLRYTGIRLSHGGTGTEPTSVPASRRFQARLKNRYHSGI